MCLQTIFEGRNIQKIGMEAKPLSPLLSMGLGSLYLICAQSKEWKFHTLQSSLADPSEARDPHLYPKKDQFYEKVGDFLEKKKVICPF